MTNRIVLTLLGLGLTASLASAQSPTTTPPTTDPHATVNQRLENQKVYRKANDGKLTTGEKKQLNQELNKTSRQIYRARHNNRNPKS